MFLKKYLIIYSIMENLNLTKEIITRIKDYMPRDKDMHSTLSKFICHHSLLRDFRRLKFEIENQKDSIYMMKKGKYLMIQSITFFEYYFEHDFNHKYKYKKLML